MSKFYAIKKALPIKLIALFLTNKVNFNLRKRISEVSICKEYLDCVLPFHIYLQRPQEFQLNLESDTPLDLNTW